MRLLILVLVFVVAFLATITFIGIADFVSFNSYQNRYSESEIHEVEKGGHITIPHVDDLEALTADRAMIENILVLEYDGFAEGNKLSFLHHAPAKVSHDQPAIFSIMLPGMVSTPLESRHEFSDELYGDFKAHGRTINVLLATSEKIRYTITTTTDP